MKIPLDREKLVKVLQRTKSESDAEALAAIRAANRMLEGAGIGWTGLMPGSGVKVKVSGPAPSFVYDVPQVSIREAIEILENSDSLSEDISDIVEIYRATGIMTTGEKNAVYRAVGGILRARGEM